MSLRLPLPPASPPTSSPLPLPPCPPQVFTTKRIATLQERTGRQITVVGSLTSAAVLVADVQVGDGAAAACAAFLLPLRGWLMAAAAEAEAAAAAAAVNCLRYCPSPRPSGAFPSHPPPPTRPPLPCRPAAPLWCT